MKDQQAGRHSSPREEEFLRQRSSLESKTSSRNRESDLLENIQHFDLANMPADPIAEEQ